MTWTHVPQALLQRFVDGRLPDAVAIDVALHIDDCPACAARATAAEPLAQALASIDDPEPPLDLLASIEHQARRPATVIDGREPAIAGALLVASALVFGLAGAPTQVASVLSTLTDALATVLRTVEAPLILVAPVWAAAAMLTFAAAAMTARRLEPRTASWR